MIILVGIGCFILGGIVGVITMGLCVASSNSRVELENRQKEDKEYKERERRSRTW